MKCDLIVVLDGGRILEQGSHMQLLDIGGKYAKLWENQVTRGTLKIVVNGSPKSTKSRRGHGQKQAPPSQASPSAVVTVAHKTVSPKHNHLTTKEVGTPFCPSWRVIQANWTLRDRSSTRWPQPSRPGERGSWSAPYVRLLVPKIQTQRVYLE